MYLQLACLSKHPVPFKFSFMLPCVYHSHKFVLSAYLIIQANLGDWKDGSWFIMCSISYICHFYSTAIWLVQPLITSCLDNCNKFHTVLASALAPSIPNINSYPSGKKPQDYGFSPLPSKNICPPYFHFWFPVIILSLLLEHILSIFSLTVCIYFSKSEWNLTLLEMF